MTAESTAWLPLHPAYLRLMLASDGPSVDAVQRLLAASKDLVQSNDYDWLPTLVLHNFHQ